MSSKTLQLLAVFLLILVGVSNLATQSASSQSPSSPAPPYLDPSLPIDHRVNDLLSRMTLEEKAPQMQDVAPAIPQGCSLPPLLIPPIPRYFE